MLNEKQCECTDPGCPCCKGHCPKKGALTLYRVDIHDVTGTRFCAGCAEDAWKSGLFTERD